MAKESPLQTVKRVYGDKEKLVDSILKVATAAGEEAAVVRERLLSTSNQKLLRIAEISKSVSERYGSRDKLVDTLVASLGRAKDADYVTKLRSLSTAQLFDMVGAAERRTRRAN